MSLSITWLGHSTVVLDMDRTRLLTDPLLRRHAGILRRRGPKPDRLAWEHTDAVLLSHLHHDHAELRSLRLLPAGVPVITAPENARWLNLRNLHGVSTRDDEWLAVGNGSGVTVTLCRADHSARPMPHRPNHANGHLVRSASTTVWVAGDTSLFADLSALPRTAGGPIDLAIVPVSGWGPRLSGGHLGPVEAAEACARVGARHAVPVHWGTLHTPGGQVYPPGWMDRPGPAFVQALADRAPACVPLLLERGVTAVVGGPA